MSDPKTKKRPRATAFPLSRIKKIMQMDEDVGKVAGGTPVGVSKALERFLQDLVDSTVKEAQTTGSKKISPHHLKRAIQVNEQFDFLKDIVQEVVEPPPPQEGGAADEPKRKRKKTVKKLAKEEEMEEDEDDE